MLLVAGIIDGISGGGGLIALPSYLAAGLPITSAYACNKMQSCLGTSASLYKYARRGMLDIRTALPAAATAIIGSLISTRIMLLLSESVKSVLIVVMMCAVLALTAVTGFMKTDLNKNTRLQLDVRTLLLCLFVGLLLGFYDGFFGPGGGTVALLLFALIMKYDLRVGCGNGKLIIVVSNLTAMITYIIHGDVIYYIAIPCSAANIVGSYIGASLATSRGARFVKYISWAVVCALIVYTVTELIK